MELNSRKNIIDRLSSRPVTIDEFNYDKLSAPPLYSLITQYHIDQLYKIATSVKYSGNPARKYKMIDDILTPLGFRKLSAGTNRLCYRHLQFDSIVLKVAYDAIGIGDNPREYKNQFKLKPFVTKVFEVDPTGTVALVERVVPITSREEFLSVANDVFEMVSEWIIGKYIMADIGSKFFMNYGIREGFGPILLDFPYLYELDGDKLYCTSPDLNGPNGRCEGEIDYDDGYNFLKCTKCGRRYRVRELAKSIEENTILVKENGRRRSKMIIEIMRGNQVIKTVGGETPLTQGMNLPTESIQKAKETKPHDGLVVVGEYVTVKKKGNKNEKNNSGKTENRSKNNNNVVSNKDQKKPIVKDTEDYIERQCCDHGSAAVSCDESSAKVETEPLNVKFEMYDAEYHLFKGVTRDGRAVTIKMEDLPKEFVEDIAENSELYSKFIDASSELESYQDSEKELCTEVGNLTAKTEKLTKENSDYKKKITDLKKQVKEAAKNDELDKLKKEIEKITKENEKLKKELSKKEEQADESEEMKELLENCKREQDYNNELRDKLDKATDEIEKLKKKNKSLNKQLDICEKQMNTVTLDKDSMDMNTFFDIFSKDKYPGFSFLHGVLTSVNTIKKSLGEKEVDKELDRKMIVFPGTDGGFMYDINGSILAVTAINNSFIDDIIDGETPLFEDVYEEEEPQETAGDPYAEMDPVPETVIDKED